MDLKETEKSALQEIEEAKGLDDLGRVYKKYFLRQFVEYVKPFFKSKEL